MGLRIVSVTRFVTALTVLIGVALAVVALVVTYFMGGPNPMLFLLVLGAYGVLLIALSLLMRLGRSVPRAESRAEHVVATPAAPASLERLRQVVVPDLEELRVEPRDAGPAPAFPTPSPRRVAPPTFRLRGFTLYERSVKRKGRRKTIRLFAKKKPVGGAPIPLPLGTEAVWDAQRKRPALRQVSVAVAPESAETRVGQPRCEAIDDIGYPCGNYARSGSPYCLSHARYKPRAAEAHIEVRSDSARATPSVVPVVRERTPTVPPPRMAVPAAKPRTMPPDDDDWHFADTRAATKSLRREGLGSIQIEQDRGKAAKAPPARRGAEIKFRTDRPRRKSSPVPSIFSNVEIRKPVSHIRPTFATSLSPRDASPARVVTRRRIVPPPDRIRNRSAVRRPPRCAAKRSTGKRCTNLARAESPFCAMHSRPKRPQEILVVRDTKSRTRLGLPSIAVGPRKGRPR